MKSVPPLWKWIILLLLAAAAIAASFYFDGAVRTWVAQHPSPAAKFWMHGFSRWGDWPEHVLAGLCLVAVAWARASKRWVRIGLTMILACALAGLVARGLKIATARPRPSARHELRVHGRHFRTRLSSRYNSFPSGHTAATTAFFGVLFFANRRIAICLLPIPVLIACSRIYVAAHYLSDVISAAVLGIFCAWILWQVQLKIAENSA